jgi:PEP-CTERM motif
VTFSGLEFSGLPGTGLWRPDGSATNRIDGQRVVAETGLLSDSDWNIAGTVSANGTQGSKTKIWIAAQNAALKPPKPPVEAGALPIAQAVPEPTTIALMLAGLAWLGLRARRPDAAR